MEAKINVDLEVGSESSASGGGSVKSRRVDVSRIAKRAARRRTKVKQRVEPSYMVDPGVRMLVKSAGGKSWIMNGFAHLFPEPDTIGVMHEPCVGGGAVGA